LSECATNELGLGDVNEGLTMTNWAEYITIWGIIVILARRESKLTVDVDKPS